MKKKIITFAVILMSFCIFSVKTFAQPVPGGSAGDPGTVPNPPESDIVFDLGTAGTLDISPSSPYYDLVISALAYFHITLTNGVVTFPTLPSYTGCLLSLYYSHCINYTCYHNACKNPPKNCH